MYSIGLDHKSLNSSVSFKGGFMNYDRALIENTGVISKKSTKLLGCLNQLIDKNWSEIKKGKLLIECPTFHYNDKNGYVSIKPIYTQKYPALLIEQDSGKYNHKILMDRTNPNHFFYEKVIPTDHGSATVRSYNSAIESDKNIDNTVNNILERSLKNIIPMETLRTDFADCEFIHNHGGIVLK